MNVKELVGKKAIRTGPVNYGNGREDYSYTREPLLILAATESHIVYEHVDGFLKGDRSILDKRWNDDNWGDYEELMRLADEVKEHLAPEPINSTLCDEPESIDESSDKDTDDDPITDHDKEIIH